MKALQKDTLREIKKSRNRFLSIVAIIALGICFFVGVKTTGPSMKHTVSEYYQNQQLMDMRLVSTYGFLPADVEAIKNTPGVATVMPSYSADVIIERGDKRPVIKMMAFQRDQTLNQPVLVAGRLPENAGEILMEQPQEDKGMGVSSHIYQLGEVIKLFPEVGDKALSESIKRDQFTIVGFVRSPQFVSIERGSTSVGRGEVDYYGFIPVENFAFERFTEVYLLSQASVEGVKPYSDEYASAIVSLENKLEALGIEQLEINYSDIMDKAQAELDKGRVKYNDGVAQFNAGIAQGEASLADARNQLVDGEAALSAGWDEYYFTIAQTQAQLDDARNQIVQGEAQLINGAATLKQELAAGEAQLETLRQGISELKRGIAQMEAQDPSGQLPDLEAQLAELENQITQGERALANLKALQVGVEGQIQSLDPTAPDYQERLAALEAQLAEINSQIAGVEAGLSQAYAGRDQIQQGIDDIYAFQAQLNGMRIQLAELEATLPQAEAALAQAKIDGENQLSAGWTKLADSKKQLNAGIAAFEAGKEEGLGTLIASQAKLEAGWGELADGEAQLVQKRAEGEAELANAANELAKAEAKIGDLEFGKWYLFNRDDNPGYTSYGEDAQRIDNISGVFPLIFLLVAALVSFTTMTRMVEEQRTQIGTLKALGYRHYQIGSKFFIYALLAGSIGSAIGLIIGINTLPYLISSAYGLLYQVPDLVIAPPWLPIIVSCLIAISCTVAAAVIVTHYELKEHPSELMRPKAPKIGKRIFLESIPFIWKRLGFIEKVTARNLLRYKGRFFMTVIGIAGCTALILAGFGLQDAIFSMIPRQFENITVFDGYMALKNEGTLAEKADFKKMLDSDSRFGENMLAHQSKMTIEKAGTESGKAAYLFVPETAAKIDHFIHLQDRSSGEAINLEAAGAVLSEKVANSLGLKVGDTIRIYNDDESHEVVLGAITENYLENYLYLSPAVYEKAFGNPLMVNMAYVNIPDTNTDLENAIANEWLAKDGVVAVNFTGNIVKSSSDSLSSLSIVVVVMLISAGALAAVVLYNLTNINISERVREIATIRVLGFYDMEVYKYIFRENIVLSAIGIVVGLFLGVLLDGFIINTVETDIAMFAREIEPTSFIYSVVFTLAFTFIVNILMTPLIKRISMVESLKSIE
ncbi:ABC transporter permease [Acetobacterium wieringae]|uniref:ABC transporter permease n=1 Tax=Acetobacterium wieringae TaxID=52694 RepID=A0ABY6HJP2_9FIRM|nr:FtsX-like permease family protein [Acetobacterium wieringae]UYO63763.1 ABC transporter permease [Acetobacterium wieringae]VUZ27372.1 Chromosome partition protein Smc [Acetobacterium wieringae]